MKVAQLADLAGTTVRTVRHYHAVGLLPVPETVDGWRDYDVTHLARLARIRWLVEAGLSLETIAEVLDASARTAREDLEEVLAGIDRQMTELAARRDRLAGLLAALDRASDDGAPATSPLPPTVARFFDTMEARAEEPATLRAIRRERAFTEAAYCRGTVPPEAELLFTLDTRHADETLRSYARIRDGLTDAEVREHARDVVERMKDTLGDRLEEVARTVDADMVAHMYDLFLRSADPAGRRVGEETRRLVLAELAARRQA